MVLPWVAQIQHEGMAVVAVVAAAVVVVVDMNIGAAVDMRHWPHPEPPQRESEWRMKAEPLEKTIAAVVAFVA